MSLNELNNKSPRFWKKRIKDNLLDTAQKTKKWHLRNKQKIYTKKTWVNWYLSTP